MYCKSFVCSKENSRQLDKQTPMVINMFCTKHALMEAYFHVDNSCCFHSIPSLNFFNLTLKAMLLVCETSYFFAFM